MDNNTKQYFIAILVTSIIVSSIFGGIMGFWAAYSSTTNGNVLSWLTPGLSSITDKSANQANEKIVTVDEESSVVNAVEKVSPAVVSIIITKDLPVIERYYSEPFGGGSDFFQQFFGDNFDQFFNQPQYRQNGTKKQEVGGGSGFIISSDGYILTNKHVVSDEEAEYTVLMNDGSKHTAKVLGRDPANDLAIMKIDGKDLPTVELGDSSGLKVGQSVIAIGNALGEFRNTVSTGVISGLSRSITAGSFRESENLFNVIQTDASINSGNSGGPLLNISGQVIGINTAIVQGAQNIGFALPVNDAKNIIDSIKQYGRIVRPWLGVRYVLVNEEIAKENKLTLDYGALVVRGSTEAELAVVPGSPADKSGIVENDIILEIDGKKITSDNPLSIVISKFKPGDIVSMKIFHKSEAKEIKVKLEEMK